MHEEGNAEQRGEQNSNPKLWILCGNNQRGLALRERALT